MACLLLSSCIPVRIAPKIKKDKVIVAKKFKRQLPGDHAYIFKDPKDADEFYHYINTKYELNHLDVESNVPVMITGETYFLSFYEVERTTKTINLVPVIVDARRESNGNDPILEDLHVSRTGHWYLVLLVSDSNMSDCLKPNYKNRTEVLNFLNELRLEYLNTTNYLDPLLRK
jgi:hypothetical protein